MMPLDAALADLRSQHTQLIDALEPMTDADLQAPYRHFLPTEPGEGDGPPGDGGDLQQFGQSLLGTPAVDTGAGGPATATR